MNTTDPEVKALIKTLIHRYGTAAAVARHLHIADTTFIGYKNGKAKRISELMWMAMQQALVEAPVPSKPLRSRITKASRTYWQSIDDTISISPHTPPKNRSMSGMNLMLRHYAARFGVDLRTANRHRELVMKESRIKIQVADQWCCFLGIHPVELWPAEWPLVEAGV